VGSGRVLAGKLFHRVQALDSREYVIRGSRESFDGLLGECKTPNTLNDRMSSAGGCSGDESSELTVSDESRGH